jgi:hypothetical protein
MTPIWIYSIWIAFAVVSGLLEGVYYNKVSKHQIKRFKSDHAAFTVVRGLVAGVLLFICFGFAWQFLVGGFLFVLAFPFFHDGMYYQYRNDYYKKGWFDHTTTSDAKFNFDFKTRLLMFIISLIFLLL